MIRWRVVLLWMRCLALWFRRRMLTAKYGRMELLSAIIAGGIGLLLGGGADLLYGRFEDAIAERVNTSNYLPIWVGMGCGAIMGVFCGVWHAQYLRRMARKAGSGWQLVGWGILNGIGLGVVCSTMVHAVLMAGYRTWDIRWMLIGDGFGVVAGLLAGLVFSAGYHIYRINAGKAQTNQADHLSAPSVEGRS